MDDSMVEFDALCLRVKQKIVTRHGASAAKDFILLLELIRLLGVEKMDRPVVLEKDVDSLS